MKRENAIVETIVHKHVELSYVEYLPAAYDREVDRSWPLVIFLHGAGERGSDLALVTKHGPPRLIADGREFPFVLLAPQCPEHGWWDAMNDELEALLDHACRTYRVDDSRIYLTGLSMGGYGTWAFAVRHPRAFAAVVPVCGGADRHRGFPARVRAIREVPVWAFHGEDDNVVPPEETTVLVEELRRAGAPDVQVTLYPGVGHDSWNQAYATEELYEWMLDRKNPDFSAAREG
jgi:predicted peptidase